jgi:hypothetical protein
VRNHLAETQITDESAERLARLNGSGPHAGDTPWLIEFGSTNHVVERSIGTYFTAATHPAFQAQTNLRSVICCTANSIQGLYAAWEGIVTEDNGLVSVNLPLNRASEWLNVDSHLPYEGKVELKIKKAEHVLFRVPDYADRLTVKVNGRSEGLAWANNYIFLTGLSYGETVSITFDLKTWTEAHHLKWRPYEQWREGTEPDVLWQNLTPDLYTITFKANTAVAIQSSNAWREALGENALDLYYGREHILFTEKAPMKTVDRYVPNTTVRP